MPAIRKSLRRKLADTIRRPRVVDALLTGLDNEWLDFDDPDTRRLPDHYLQSAWLELRDELLVGPLQFEEMQRSFPVDFELITDDLASYGPGNVDGFRPHAWWAFDAKEPAGFQDQHEIVWQRIYIKQCEEMNANTATGYMRGFMQSFVASKIAEHQATIARLQQSLADRLCSLEDNVVG